MPPWCSWPASTRFSRTESCGKTCSSWNVRPMPRRFRSQGPSRNRPEEGACPADDPHQGKVKRGAEGERGRLDELPQGRIEPAREAAEGRADGERHQRVALRVDAQRRGADRVFPEGGERASPRRAQQPPCPERRKRENSEAEKIEVLRRLGRPAEEHRPGNAADAIDAPRQPFFV